MSNEPDTQPTTLSDVYARRAEIIQLAKKFGFTDDIKIHWEVSARGGLPRLYLVVHDDADHGEDNDISDLYRNSWLAAKLKSMFTCEVIAKRYETIDNLYRYNYNKFSAPITDEAALCKLFNGSSLNYVVFVNRYTDSESQFTYEGVLRNAEKYLRKVTSQENQASSSSTAFEKATSRENHSDSSSSESPQQSGRSSSDAYDEIRNKRRAEDDSAHVPQEKREKTDDDLDKETTVIPIKGTNLGKNM